MPVCLVRARHITTNYYYEDGFLRKLLRHPANHGRVAPDIPLSLRWVVHEGD